MRCRALAVLAMVVSGCSASPQAAAISAVQSEVRAQLKDPDSAVFSNVSAHQGPDGLTVCGWVNARNSYGGLAGATRFYGWPGGAVVEPSSPSAIYDKQWVENGCPAPG